ncbi:MAG: site-2 protease family protein [Oscillospiraceae bacterium]|jgi:regulator of sigma E protease|nr:site-2 protease family protein [Oscillospiraceae bacterium]
MSVFISVLTTLLVLGVIIFVHEIGHFSAARLFKMKVCEFNMGMGPALFKKRGKETVYSLRIFPIGGSCVLGEDENPGDDPREFRNRPVWQRMIVIVAGAALNLVLGFVFCVIIACSINMPSTTVGRFYDGAVSNTGSSALQEGDKIHSINGMRIFSYTDMSYKLGSSPSKGGNEVLAVFEFVVIRDGEKITLPEVSFAAEPNERGGMAYRHDFAVYRIPKNFINVMSYSFHSAVSQGRIIWLSIMDLIKGTYGLNELSGPVGVAAVIDEVTSRAETLRDRMFYIISLSALISINLGIVNLLPIPALDGARLIFFAVEAVRRKPLKAEVEGTIHFVGFALLMLLMLAVTFNDIRRLVFGG